MNWRGYLIAFCLSVLFIQRIVTPAPGPVVPPVVDPDPPVVIVPPDIDPPVIPVDGKRTVVIIRESGEDTPALARMIQNLRTGENQAYFTSKGHRLHWLDDEQQDENGELLEVVQQLLPVHPELPAIHILREDGLSLHHETLSANATDDDVMRILKAWGG